MDLLDQLASTLLEQSNDGKLELAQHYEVKALSSQITQEGLARIVEEVAKNDAEAPSGEVPDALRQVKESLTALWWPVELLALRTRDYTHAGAKKKDIWRWALIFPITMIL